MPKYEVVTSPGVDYPVGKIFETDKLHKVMFQHVKPVDGKRAAAKVEPPTLDADFTLAEGLDGSTYEEALALNGLHGKTVTEPEKVGGPEKDVKDPAEKAKAPAKAKQNGPGANS